MSHELFYSYIFLSILSKFRPILGYLGLIINQISINEHRHNDRFKAFAGRKYYLHSIRIVFLQYKNKKNLKIFINYWILILDYFRNSHISRQLSPLLHTRNIGLLLQNHFAYRFSNSRNYFY